MQEEVGAQLASRERVDTQLVTAGCAGCLPARRLHAGYARRSVVLCTLRAHLRVWSGVEWRDTMRCALARAVQLRKVPCVHAMHRSCLLRGIPCRFVPATPNPCSQRSPGPPQPYYLASQPPGTLVSFHTPLPRPPSPLRGPTSRARTTRRCATACASGTPLRTWRASASRAQRRPRRRPSRSATTRTSWPRAVSGRREEQCRVQCTVHALDVACT